jgi:hypothetical protein
MKYYKSLLGMDGIESEKIQIEEFDNIIKDILRAARRAFREAIWDSNCFDKALTVKYMLSRRKIRTTIYFGAAMNGKSLIKAHAWLRYGDKIITGNNGIGKFAVVSFFS